MSTGERPVPTSRLWLLVVGFGIWCSALVVMYGFHAIGCTFGWSTYLLRLGLCMALLAHLAALGCLWVVGIRTAADAAGGPIGSFLHWVIGWTSIAAFVTVVLTLGPALLLETCV